MIYSVLNMILWDQWLVSLSFPNIPLETNFLYMQHHFRMEDGVVHVYASESGMQCPVICIALFRSFLLFIN